MRNEMWVIFVYFVNKSFTHGDGQAVLERTLVDISENKWLLTIQKFVRPSRDIEFPLTMLLWLTLCNASRLLHILLLSLIIIIGVSY